MVANKVMRNRWEIVADLINKNNFTRIAEVGVSRGENASEILKRCPQIKKFYLIDIDFSVFDRGLFAGYGDKIRLCNANGCWIEPGGYDLVFIDAEHTYEAVKKDIEKWRCPLAIGGIICGHDYLDFEQPGYGVNKAVDEVFPNRNLEDDILEDGRIKVWWIKQS